MEPSPYRRRNWLARQWRAHPMFFALAWVCVAIVVVEVVAVSGILGLATHHSGSSGTTLPPLNPFNETITAVLTNVTGPAAADFPALEHASFCSARSCPTLPTFFTLNGSTAVGFIFYFNVSNTAGHGVNLSLPALGISGTTSRLFFLVTFCCYTTTNQPYSEPLGGSTYFLPSGMSGSHLGLQGVIYTFDPIPRTASGTYTFYYNATAH